MGVWRLWSCRLAHWETEGNPVANRIITACIWALSKETLEFILWIPDGPQILFYQAAFQLGGPQCLLVPGVIPSQVSDLALLLIELHEVLASPFLQPVKVPLDASTTLWCISHSSQFCVISKLAEGTLCPSSRSLMKMLNRMRPNIDPWATPLVTGLQLDFMPLTTTLWAWPFSQFSVHLTIASSSPYFHWLLYKDLMGDSVKGLTEVRVDNVHCSPLIYQASHFITEVYQVVK
ncbi:hypothetical protein QYF61_018350 [Mycteria americana]|uniref:Uncharacterized protein n=1 Tax=Mycteria americana TaxID=33587 RepID=A0AAN7S8H1_MYCAM|nr:hypothetical protein QYF61_018350 [Mycteria americana]